MTSIGSGGPASAFGDATGTHCWAVASTTGAYLLYAGAWVETTTRTINLNWPPRVATPSIPAAAAPGAQ